MPKNYMIGNWKMNQSIEEIETFFNSLSLSHNQNNFWIAPQSLHIPLCLKLAAQKGILIGAQNCSANEPGAYTGEISAEALTELGSHFVILGHSERREYQQESGELINKKVQMALKKGQIPVLCIGESLEQREANQTLAVIIKQLSEALDKIELNNESEIIIAYEPIWAIGTGKTASASQAGEVHNEIRHFLEDRYKDFGHEISLLYGGSVKPENITELLQEKNINGGLVGGASLKGESFSKLCNAC